MVEFSKNNPITGILKQNQGREEVSTQFWATEKLSSSSVTETGHKTRRLLFSEETVEFPKNNHISGVLKQNRAREEVYRQFWATEKLSSSFVTKTGHKIRRLLFFDKMLNFPKLTPFLESSWKTEHERKFPRNSEPLKSFHPPLWPKKATKHYGSFFWEMVEFSETNLISGILLENRGREEVCTQFWAIEKLSSSSVTKTGHKTRNLLFRGNGWIFEK